MSTFLGVTCALVLTGVAQAEDLPRGTVDIWNRILSFENPPEGNPEREKYLQSLSAEEMLSVARYGCEDATKNPRFTQDWERAGACASVVVSCLVYYFDKFDSDDEAGNTLLAIVPNAGESVWFRRAIVASMSLSRGFEFGHKFRAYAENHAAELEVILGRIIKDRNENLLLRQEAIHTLAAVLGERVRAICRSDPNVQETIKEKRKHSNKVVQVNELVRSGEVTLTEDTLKALKPIEARTRAYIKVLGGILADEENEPEQLRKQARRRLEGYRKSPLTGIDDDVEKALQQPGH